MVSVLFVKSDSNYKDMNVDCYDASRNAYSYKGMEAVIAHPPCRLWSKLRAFSNAPACEMLTALFAIQVVRSNGGVLEHPVGSRLFSHYLPVPGQIDSFGGFTIKVNMSDFGFPARKPTFLYIVGIDKSDLPLIPIKFDAIEFMVGSSKFNRKKVTGMREMPKKMRDVTPLAMCEWLVDLANLIESKKVK